MINRSLNPQKKSIESYGVTFDFQMKKKGKAPSRLINLFQTAICIPNAVGRSLSHLKARFSRDRALETNTYGLHADLIQEEMRQFLSGETKEDLSRLKALLGHAFDPHLLPAIQRDVKKVMRRLNNEDIRDVIETAIEFGLDRDDPIINFTAMEPLAYETLCTLFEKTDEEAKASMKNHRENMTAFPYVERGATMHHMVYSAVKGANHTLLNFVDLIVSFSSSITHFGKMMRKNGDKIPQAIDVPLRLIACFLVLKYVMTTEVAVGLVAGLPVLGAAASGLGTAIIVLAILFPILSWCSVHFRPFPLTITGFKNMTQAVRDHEAGFIPSSRKGEYENQMRALCEWKHVMYTYGDGSYDTSFISAFAEMMAQNAVPDQALFNKELFSYDLSSKTEDEMLRDLEYFEGKIQQYQQHIVLCLDNAHLAPDSVVRYLEKMARKVDSPYIFLMANESERIKGALRSIHGFQNSDGALNAIEDQCAYLQEFAMSYKPYLDEIDPEVIKVIIEASSEFDYGLLQPGQSLALLKDILDTANRIGSEKNLRIRSNLTGDYYSQAAPQSPMWGEEGSSRMNSYYEAVNAGSKNTTLADRKNIQDAIDDEAGKVYKLWRLRMIDHVMKKAKLEAALKEDGKAYMMIHHGFEPVMTKALLKAQGETEIGEGSSSSNATCRPIVDKPFVEAYLEARLDSAST